MSEAGFTIGLVDPESTLNEKKPTHIISYGSTLLQHGRRNRKGRETN